MQRSTLLKLGLAASVFPFGAAALAKDQPSAQLSDVIKLAQKEGQLNILQQNFGDPAMWAKIQAALATKYHVDVRLVGRPGPPSSALAARLAEEMSAGRTPSSDIILNPPVQQISLDRAQVPLRVNWHELDPSIPPAVIGKNGSNLVVGGTVFVAAYNTQILHADAVPKTLDDLRNPRYNGLISTTSYGGAWLPIAVAVGVNEVTSLLKTISANGNLKGFIPMTDIQSVASGQFGILLFADSYVTSKKLIASAPIATASLGVCSGTTLSLNIAKGTASPNLAKLVGVFLASHEGQAILLEFTGHDSPFIPGSTSYQAFEAARKHGQKVVIETDELIAANPQVYGPLAKDYAQLVGAR